ncbi:F-box/WD repeat-containing protein 8-like isoform X2 [Anneissia japonica]|uniref:F-box/WD repeat-containing protein 8-like isoform X2 n=1 Tax=Anneissia japonica TaxID=1529436 RepID=UPI0014255E85|nr:F-box/WD repeat-containing protein 8-like isoform X2 [Anneissia japonica]
MCSFRKENQTSHSQNIHPALELTTYWRENELSIKDEINDIPFFDIEIPRELGIKIFQYLSMQDLCNCAQVSSSWRSLADDQLLWFPFYKALGFSTDVTIDSEASWKLAVRDGLMQRDLLINNWKGRIGRVTTLEHITGGVLCAVSSCDIAIIAGFSNGSVKLWKVNRQVEEETMLCSCYDNMGLKNADRPSVNHVAVNSVISVATYNNGDVDIWSTQHGGDPIHHYHQDGIQCVSIATDDAQVVSASGKELRIEAADNSGNWFMQDCITLDKYIDNVKIFQVPNKKQKGSYVSVSTANGLYIYKPAPGPRYLSLVHTFVGSTPTCMEVISDHIACGFGAAGFQESFTVKLFDIETKNVKHVFRGHSWDVTCLHSDDALQSMLVTGCKDKRVRLFDFRLKSNQPVVQLSGHGGAITQVQVDEWKVLSGGMEGMVCLWDQRMQRKLWDSYARHPVRYLCFKGGGLVTANIPNVKSLEDELETVTHRRLRGELRHYNFLANQTREGLPSVCLSNYDEPEGYNYNIRLAAPYDNL